MVLFEFADEVETIAAFATLVLCICARAFDLDRTTLEASQIRTALLGLFGIEQCTTNGSVVVVLDHVGGRIGLRGGRGACIDLCVSEA